MKYKNLYILLILFFACKNQTNSEIQEKSTTINSNDTIEINLIRSLSKLSIVDRSLTYDHVKNTIEEHRLKLKSSKIELDSISVLFKIALVNKIIPFWEGTEWSFEGHTSKPGIGEIACGYFVSTTLQDIGLNINRYKLAQQSPINEAKSLALKTLVHEISKASTSENISAINKLIESGIHFIGFDESHVGYLLKEEDNLYLIHSNYQEPFQVEIEPLNESAVFQSYSKYYIVELSTNPELMNLWLSGRKIEIINN